MIDGVLSTGEISEVGARYCDVIDSLQLSTQPNAYCAVGLQI